MSSLMNIQELSESNDERSSQNDNDSFNDAEYMLNDDTSIQLQEIQNDPFIKDYLTLSEVQQLIKDSIKTTRAKEKQNKIEKKVNKEEPKKKKPKQKNFDSSSKLNELDHPFFVRKITSKPVESFFSEHGPNQLLRSIETLQTRSKPSVTFEQVLVNTIPDRNVVLSSYHDQNNLETEDTPSKIPNIQPAHDKVLGALYHNYDLRSKSIEFFQRNLHNSHIQNNNLEKEHNIKHLDTKTGILDTIEETKAQNIHQIKDGIGLKSNISGKTDSSTFVRKSASTSNAANVDNKDTGIRDEAEDSTNDFKIRPKTDMVDPINPPQQGIVLRNLRTPEAFKKASAETILNIRQRSRLSSSFSNKTLIETDEMPTITTTVWDQPSSKFRRFLYKYLKI